MDPILLVGRRGGPEERLVPEAGFPLATVPVRGLDRDAPLKNLALPVMLPVALAQAVRIVDGFRPDVVLGTGAYAMVPALVAARLRGIPYVLLAGEATGLATRLLASSAAAICVTFEGAQKRLRARRVVVTGYPIRGGFQPRTPAMPPRRLLVVGGSQGARRLNLAVWGALDELCRRFEEVIHLTGAQGQEELEARRRPGYRPLTFSADMQGLMAEADLVLCRAGVSTFSEFTAVGLPAIVVPGTFGGGHQEANAQALEAAGAAVRVGDEELTPARLLEVIDGLDAHRLGAMAAASRAFGRPDAASRVLAVLSEVAAA